MRHQSRLLPHLRWSLIASMVLLFSAGVRCQSAAASAVPTPVSSVSFRGASLQVMQLGSLRFVEPFIAVQPDACTPSVTFDQLAGRHSLRLPLILDTAGLPGSAEFTPTQLEPRLRGPANSSTIAAIDCSIDRPTAASLVLWCDSFDRCQQLRWAAVSSPKAVAASLLFTVTGVLGGGQLVSLPGRQLQVLPQPSPASLGCGTGWVLFQQRVDGSLSFQQNWDTYVRGFGHPDSNYWMGLEQISASTLMSLSATRCSLRVEVVDVYGTNYWAESTGFQVLGAVNSYMLYSPASISTGSLYFSIFASHSGQPFLTYDRDVATYCSGGCSKLYGHAGWWWTGSFRFNLNGMYTEKAISATQNGYMQAMVASGSLIDMKTSRMYFKC